MNLRKIFGVCLLFSLLANYSSLHAFETDQYNLPPVPLADIGDEVSAYVEDNIRIAIGKINAEIAVRQLCVNGSTRSGDCGSPERESKQLAYLRSDEAVAREVFKRLGDGIIPFTRSQTWLNSHNFRSQPARYQTGYGRSIFVWVPTNYLTISPTVNMYGSSFGTDKIAHIFQQGFEYYRIRNEALGKGETDAAAERKAVKNGVFSEKTYFGTFVSGVFSNADLAANYAGIMFYRGLTETIRFGDVVRIPTVALTDGQWKFIEASRDMLLRPFISDHLNEALNPSLFIPGLRSSIRGIVKKQSCRQWRSLSPGRTRLEYANYSRELSRWYGMDYGFRESTKFITIANTCF